MEKKISQQCDCQDCEKYRDIYDTIVKSNCSRWLTISPPYSDEDPQIYIRKWDKVLSYVMTFAPRWLFVYEISSQQRIHIHGIYQLRDRVKEYLFLNRLRNGMSTKCEIAEYGKPFCRPNMVRVYDGTPLEGLHYLFKDIKDLLDMGLSRYMITNSSCGYQDN